MPAKTFKTVARCYGSMALFLSVAHNVFLLYYVDMFVNVYKIDKVSFWVGEVTFLVWNSINDPLFGWLSDKKLLQSDNKSEEDQLHIVTKRVALLQWNGPLFALSFLLFWVQWLPISLQFVVCLCLYDGFLTTVDLQHTALLADLAVHANERNMLNRYCSIFSALGSASVFASYIVWSRHSTLPFQVFCVAVACFSACGLYAASKILLRKLPEMMKHSERRNLKLVNQSPGDSSQTSQVAVSPLKYIKQLASNKNFRWFTAMNIFQVFHCHFNSNFFPLFMDTLVGDSVPSSVCTLLIGLSFVAPHVNNVYFLHLCKTYGVYKVISLLFWAKLLLAACMLLLGPNYVWVTCLFIASNRIFTEGTCKLLNLVVSDMVDEDYVLNKRPHPASALLFGMSSLLSKPGQTLAPLLGTYILSAYTGEDLFHPDSPDTVVVGVKTSLNKANSQSYRNGCFTILVTVPVVCACFQIAAWNRFSLRGTRLQRIKNLRICSNLDCV